MDPAEIRLIKLAFESIREPPCFLNCHLGNQLTSAQWSLHICQSLNDVKPKAQVFPLLQATVVIFSADLKSFLSHLLNVHFPITRSSIAFLKKKVMLLCYAID